MKNDETIKKNMGEHCSIYNFQNWSNYNLNWKQSIIYGLQNNIPEETNHQVFYEKISLRI